MAPDVLAQGRIKLFEIQRQFHLINKIWQMFFKCAALCTDRRKQLAHLRKAGEGHFVGKGMGDFGGPKTICVDKPVCDSGRVNKDHLNFGVNCD
jgi:hypothetical protein